MNIRKFPEKFVKEARFIYHVEILLDLYSFSEVFQSIGAEDWEEDTYRSKEIKKEYSLIFPKQIDIDETITKIQESLEKEYKYMIYDTKVRMYLSEEEIEYELPTINLEDSNNGRQKRSISNLRLRENLRSEKMCP